MADVFIGIILGHCVADYLLQPRKMSMSKSEPGPSGLFWSVLHCLIYAASVCTMIWDFRPLVLVAVFFSHWPIDRYALASKWIKLIGGRDLTEAFYSGKKYPEVDAPTIIGMSFGCIVYVMVDATMHMLPLWWFCKLYLMK